MVSGTMQFLVAAKGCGTSKNTHEHLSIARTGCPIPTSRPFRCAILTIHRAEALELYALDRDWLAALTARLERRMEFALTVADRNVYLSLGAETLTCAIRRAELVSVP